MTLIRKFKLLPVYAMYIMMLGQAAVSKFSTHGTPEWFEKKFAGTILDAFTGAIPAQYYLIAVIESLLALAFVVSLFKGEFQIDKEKPLLKLALIGSCVLFVMLSFGLRITGDFATSSQTFIYFASSFALFEYLELVRS